MAIWNVPGKANIQETRERKLSNAGGANSEVMRVVIPNMSTEVMNIVDDPDAEKSAMMARIDAPGGFGHPPEDAGIAIITKRIRFSETDPQCAEDPELPWNWHYNTLGTLQLEKYLQTKYPAENIRIDNPEYLYTDMQKNPENYISSVGYRGANGGDVWNRNFSYFHASGGVLFVWRRCTSGQVNSDGTHPALGMSVRLRRG